jgi:hypothetical protein
LEIIGICLELLKLEVLGFFCRGVLKEVDDFGSNPNFFKCVQKLVFYIAQSAVQRLSRNYPRLVHYLCKSKVVRIYVSTDNFLS